MDFCTKQYEKTNLVPQPEILRDLSLKSCADFMIDEQKKKNQRLCIHGVHKYTFLPQTLVSFSCLFIV